MPLKTTVRFTHAVIIRAPSLLPMLHTPRELEEALRIPARAICSAVFNTWAVVA